MKVYICYWRDLDWPVDVSSVVVAKDEAEARLLLAAELKSRRYDPAPPVKAFTVRHVDTNAPKAVVIREGNGYE